MEQNETQNGLIIQTDKLLNASKKELNNKVNHFVQLVKDGAVDKMQAYIYAKKLESIGKELAKQVKEYADDTTIEKGGVTMYNAVITQGEQGVKWDYEATEDPEWINLDKQIKELTEKKKERETFLQSIKKDTTLLDVDTGEYYTIKPAIKSGTLGLTVKLK